MARRREPKRLGNDRPSPEPKLSLDPIAPNGKLPWDLVEGSGPDLSSAVTSLVDRLADEDADRICDCRVLEDLYWGRWVSSDDLMPGVMAYGAMGGDPVKLNFARNAVDFVHTKVCADVPAVVASSIAADYAASRRADDLSKTIDGAMSAADADGVLAMAALSALRTGTAFVKAVPPASDGGPASFEQVPAEMMFVDPTEARWGSVRSLYERRPVPRRYVGEAWVATIADKDDRQLAEVSLASAPLAVDPLLSLTELARESTHAGDLVDLYEAWCLPSADGSRPGRHVVCVHGAVLHDSEWTSPRFPHAVLRISEPAPGRGFWGQGMLEQLDEPQAEIDFLLGQVSEQIRFARLKYFVPADERTSDDALRASFNGSIIRYSSRTVPSAVTPQTVSREALEHIRYLVEQLYSIAGMSEQAASSQRPAGINSGRAILFFHDFQTRRYVDLVKRFGTFCVDATERLLDAMGQDVGDGMEVRLEEVSAVPGSYAGRMQRIEQLIAQGQIPEGYWATYLQDPDAWRAEHRASSQSEYLDWAMGRLHDDGAGIPAVDDHQDMDMALEVLNGEILTLVRTDADEPIVDRFRDYYDRIVARRKELQELQAPIPQAPQGTAPELAKMGADDYVTKRA